MAEKRPDQKKKGRPAVETSPMNIRMPDAMLAAIDDYRRTVPEIPSRPEVIRRVLADFLAREVGYKEEK